MQPTRPEMQGLPPPPGILGSLRAGFDAVANHVGAILMPLALDLLLWLGPHVSVDRLAQPVIQQIGAVASGSGLQPQDVNSAVDMYRQFFGQLNVLVVLRTFPVGIFSLMSGRMPTHSPLGAPQIVQLGSFLQFLGLMFVLTVAGWILGALYFQWVAALVQPSEPTGGTSSRAVSQVVLYSIVCAILAWTLGLPVLFVIYVLFAINALLGEGAVLLLGFLGLWLLVPVFFSPHGIFMRRQNAFASVLGGFQLTRLTLPSSSLFVLIVVLIGMGLNLLWAVPAEDSWLALVGILGHAFITTALLASSFIYYKDMSAWLQTVLARLRPGLPTQQA